MSDYLSILFLTNTPNCKAACIVCSPIVFGVFVLSFLFVELGPFPLDPKIIYQPIKDQIYTRFKFRKQALNEKVFSRTIKIAAFIQFSN